MISQKKRIFDIAHNMDEFLSLNNIAYERINYFTYDNRVQFVLFFENNYGASLVQGDASYGGENGLWELAVMLRNKKKKSEYRVCYETPITDDVLGYLEKDDVIYYLKEIANLK